MTADQRVEVLETETVGYLRSHAVAGSINNGAVQSVSVVPGLSLSAQAPLVGPIDRQVTDA